MRNKHISILDHLIWCGYIPLSSILSPKQANSWSVEGTPEGRELDHFLLVDRGQAGQGVSYHHNRCRLLPACRLDWELMQ